MPVGRTGEEVMDVGSRQGHCPVSPTHSRHVQHHSRHRIPDSPGQVRLDALPMHISSHQGSFQAPGHGPICLQTDVPDTLLLQLRPDPLAKAANAFQQDWGPLRGFANPPWCLISRVLSQVRHQQAQLVPIVPVWRGQTWYPVLLEMLWDLPRLVSPVPDLIQRPSGSRMEMAPQLTVWPVSGKDSQVAAFQKKLLNSCYSHGGPTQPTPATHNFKNGPCGVLKGVAILFQDPPLM